MESFAFWFFCVVMLPFALLALGGPLVLRSLGMRALLACAVVIWLTPAALYYALPAVPEILIWILPFGGQPLSPPLEALVCAALPVWLSLAAIRLGARARRSLALQSVASAGVSAALLMLMSAPLQIWVVQHYPPGT